LSSAFTVEDLVACYARGVFPMAETREDPRIFLVEPERRGVIPLDAFHIPGRLARTVRADRFETRIDTAFEEVIDACARPRTDREETWINRPIRELYVALFARGCAHSLECWLDGKLVGGLYGVRLGAAFFGESMFSRERDASKVALVHLVARMIEGGFALLDTQFLTTHLARFGAFEIPRDEYLKRLERAVAQKAEWPSDKASMTGVLAMHLIAHAQMPMDRGRPRPHLP
jgi:leucyl/phenylalanyl-tRNA---protein transferase